MLEYPFTSLIYLTLTALYFFVASIVTFDIRLIQARKFQGVDYGELPRWVGIFHFLEWITFVALFVLNWKYALIIFAVKFILKVIPVLETIGSVIMSPFRPKLPEGISVKHLEVADAVKALQGLPSGSKLADEGYNTAIEKIDELEFADSDENAVLIALEYLGGDEHAKSDASYLYRQQKESFERNEYSRKKALEFDEYQRKEDLRLKKLMEEFDEYDRELEVKGKSEMLDE